MQTSCTKDLKTLRFQIPRAALWTALQNHKSFQKIFLLLRPTLTVCLWSVRLTVLPNYRVKNFRTCCLWQGFRYLSLEGNTATHIITPPRYTPKQLSAEIHGWEFHVKICIFFPLRNPCSGASLIVTCWTLLNGRSGMTLRGEQLMLFTAIGLPCLSRFLIGAVVHCSAENDNCNQFQTRSPWFWTTDANGRSIADLISCRI